MKDDGKNKRPSEKECQEIEQQVTVFSNGFGHVEVIILPQLEVMARLSTWTS